jgi:hypothetical protein
VRCVVRWDHKVGRWATIHVFTSSMMMIAALLSSALAMHRSCLCPTEKFDPFSSTTGKGGREQEPE